MTASVLEVKSLVKQYGTLRAVDDISFEVFEGEVFAAAALSSWTSAVLTLKKGFCSN